MKKIYRIGSVAIALTLTLALSVTPAFAEAFQKSTESTEASEAEEAAEETKASKTSSLTVTVQNAVSGKQYSAYRIFTASASASSKAVSYAIRADSDWFDDVAAYIGEDADEKTGVYTGEGLTLTPKSGGKVYSVTQTSDFSAEAFAEYLSSCLKGKTAAAEATAEDGVCALDIEDSGKGYYLIQSDLGSALCTVTAVAKLTEKNASPTVTLEVEEASAEESPWGSASTAQIGDTVAFRVRIDALDGDPQDYVLHVTLGDGLVFTEESIDKVTLNDNEIFERQTDTLTEAASYAVLTGEDAAHVYLDGNVQKTLTHTFDLSLDNLLTNDVVTVEFHAVVADADAENTKAAAYLTCTDYKGEHTTATSAAAVTTCSVTLSGVDENGDPLAGGVYRIYRNADDTTCVSFSETEADEKTVYIADSEGTVDELSLGSAELAGLDAGTYYLEQVSAPDGYEALDDRLELTVSAAAQTVTIESLSGAVLPETGGSGSMPYFIAGAALMLLALFGFLARKKPSALG